ncbi:ABC transporter ATP-binding protein [Pyrobaculum calidifontis]|uniref:Carbohydrate ABC transporter ATP-binding protein, CUT1 family n=1 Tax=Pyrobaculum calidifontis (strain DSM 21063 / JCM 11548 / VA1) TaxID=410359 RepID=A3MVW3_PYRCJ|nr:ABC transporter ATP-binding protein [Pyrobaculum calidifontis]ABO08780.1 carbohydrate ABC transporter ATP-binding protein, CUT1 family [Pyrobaculum calidifontis JCM 11548]
MTFVVLDRVTKRFGNVVAVDNVSLEVKKGEFVVFLGPSGCGKTTTLRIIAGLERPTSGRVYIDGVDVTDLEPGERDVAMVFQDYAIYPHMTVFQNIAFPLEVNKKKLRLTPRDIRERVERVAKMLQIDHLLNRKASQLSGGQQQRVALARALVREPKVWLMDEPLSNLDALIRLQVRAELKRLQRDLGITTIYVTHDQVEALTLADRIAVMNAGRVVQYAPPGEIYDEPQHMFVATFVGNPPMNVLKCTPAGEVLKCPGFELRNPGVSQPVYFGIRPEYIEWSPKHVEGAVKGVVYVVEPIGSEYIINVTLGNTLIKVKTFREVALRPGDEIYLRFNLRKAKIFDEATGKLLLSAVESATLGGAL